MINRQHVATAARADDENPAVGHFAKRETSVAGERLRAAKGENVRRTDTRSNNEEAAKGPCVGADARQLVLFDHPIFHRP